MARLRRTSCGRLRHTVVRRFRPGDGVRGYLRGWNDAVYISAELKDGRRNMLCALVLSIGIITVLYLLVTWAYWSGLGLAGMASSEAIAADLLRAAFGETASTLIAIMVAIAALTSINATMIVGLAPLRVAVLSGPAGRHWYNCAAGRCGLCCGLRRPCYCVDLRARRRRVRTMVNSRARFLLFFLLSGLRVSCCGRRTAVERPFRVPLIPAAVESSRCRLWTLLGRAFVRL